MSAPTTNLIVTTPVQLEQLIAGATRRAVEGCLTGLLAPTANPSPTEYLKKREAAQLLSVSTSTIDNYVRRGKLAKYPFGSNGGVRFKRSDLLQLIKD